MEHIYQLISSDSQRFSYTGHKIGKIFRNETKLVEIHKKYHC